MYRSVVPEYFESVLQLRYSTDEEMAEMFDLIRSSRSFSISCALEDPELMIISSWSIKAYIAQNPKYGNKNWSVVAAENELIAMAQLERIGKIYGFTVNY
jgi:hypothetical protein